MSVIISAAHAGALATIHALCFPPGEAWTRGALGALLATPGIIGRVIESGGFVLARHAMDTADIVTLAVLPTLRRQGCGRLLVSELLLDLQAQGVAEVLLEVGNANHAARRLYETLGFQAVGLRRGYYADGSDAVLMSVSLAPPSSTSSSSARMACTTEVNIAGVKRRVEVL